MEGETLDSISMWHVLEHVYPLDERLKIFHRILKEEGMLFVAVPNMLSHDAQKYGRFWAAWDVPRHIHHFSPSSIKQLFENSGFEFIRSKPMLLDAFYISMLSEKYKHGHSNIFRAVTTGLHSNLKAHFGNRNYSSLIYIFKKS
jgi:predicted SAM-dependent methyltransferase